MHTTHKRICNGCGYDIESWYINDAHDPKTYSGFRAIPPGNGDEDVLIDVSECPQCGNELTMDSTTNPDHLPVVDELQLSEYDLSNEEIGRYKEIAKEIDELKNKFRYSAGEKLVATGSDLQFFSVATELHEAILHNLNALHRLLENGVEGLRKNSS